MRYKTLGNTGVFVSELCLGTMTFGGRGFWTAIGTLDQAAVDGIVASALNAGINFIDTADSYSDGLSEELTGRAIVNLGRSRTDVVIATKGYMAMGKGPNDRGASRGHLMDAVKASLRRLGTDYIDLYQIHGLDKVTPIEETLRALEDLVRQGHIRYVGVSNWSAWKMMKALGLADQNGWARLSTLQAYYTIADRDLEREIVPLLEEEKVGLLVWSPLAGGILSGKFNREGKGPDGSRRASFDFPPVNKERAFAAIDVMREVGAAHEASVAQIAIVWLLHRPFMTFVIIGAKSIAQLDENIASINVRLSQDELSRLDEVSKMHTEYPAWMIEYHDSGRVPRVAQTKSWD